MEKLTSHQCISCADSRTLKDSQKLFQIAERGGVNMSPGTKFKIQRAINDGRGGIWLELTDEQYAKLKRR
jgi:hypothetical protein